MPATVLIVGASGIVGRSAVRRFEREAGWTVVGLSRRAPDYEARARFVSADLLDREACRSALADLPAISHVVYAAAFEKPNLMRGWMEADHVATNLAMLRNLLDALPAGALRHVSLMQGTKAYGAAAGPFKLPAKESDPRSLAPNFYYAQEDLLRERQGGGAGWSWTVLRPQFVCGFSVGSPMNALNALAAYVTISRDLGLPLRFPGGPSRVQEATDARLLADAMVWAATSPACANEIFNIVNGDCFTWDSLWPRIARAFEMEWAPAAPARLARIMADKGPVWDRMVERHGLRPYGLDQLVPNWALADNLLGYGTPPVPLLLSGLKARRHGFQGCVDSEDMFLEWLDLLQRDGVFPGPRHVKEDRRGRQAI